MSNRTEPPTEKRIRDARNRGEVPRSRELISAALFTTLIFYFKFFFEKVVADLFILFRNVKTMLNLNFIDNYRIILYLQFKIFIDVISPFLLIVFVISILSNLVQFGFIFAPNVLVPNFDKVDPVSGFKRIFSKKNILETVKVMFKITILGIIISYVILSSINSLIYSPACGMSCVLAVFYQQLSYIINYTVIAFIIVAAIDVFLQRNEYFDKLKMTIDEVRREYKDTEGDPLIKNRQQQLHREISEQDVENKIKQSDIVVSNPTHFAIGIMYRQEKTKMPIITIKGKGSLAKVIFRVANKLGVPIIRRVSLAQGLYKNAKEGKYIPKEFIVPIVKIIYLLKRRLLK